jgi:anti-sigma regulatory factor (Ser/Thr protein kinase)
MTPILRVDIPRDRRAPSVARAALDTVVDRGVNPCLVPDAQLLASELITNSVKYGEGGPVVLEVAAADPNRLRVEVIDQGEGFIPVARRRPKTEVGGWGLHLVEALSDSWGVHEGSTHVWFEVAA